VFQADPELSFVAGLARWLNEPAQPAPAADTPTAEEAPSAEAEPPPCSAFESECVALESKGAFDELSEKLRASLQERFAESSEQELESAYAIYLQLLVQWELLAAKVESLAAELSAKTDERPGLRRSLLFSLYALVQQFGLAELRFLVLVKLIRFAADSQQLEIFGTAETRVASVERWVSEWGLSSEQKIELWGLFFDAHADDSTAVYGYALKYLDLYDDTADINAQPLNKRLVQSVLLTICSPSLFQCDELAQLSVIKKLEQDAEHKQLHELLHIFAHKTYADYLVFQESKAGAALMAKHGVEHEVCSKKIRLLTLVSLGQENKELPYDTISAALKIAADEVETWVMEAIGCGLMTAKMDQVGLKVHVGVCIERDFGAQQWKRLSTSLADWRDSIRGLLSVIQGSRPAATPA